MPVLLSYPVQPGGGEETAGQSLAGGVQQAAGQLEPLLRPPAEVRLFVGEETVC